MPVCPQQMPTPTEDGVATKTSAPLKRTLESAPSEVSDRGGKKPRTPQEEPRNEAEADDVAGDEDERSGKVDGPEDKHPDDHILGYTSVSESESDDDDGASQVSSTSRDLDPQFPQVKRLYLSDVTAWDETWETTKERRDIKMVEFGPDFSIQDQHFVALAQAPTAFRQSLVSIRCGNTDNGYGANLSDDAVAQLAEACPGLRYVALRACTAVTDRGLLALLRHCPRLRTDEVTGHDRRTGMIKAQALEALRQEWDLGARLGRLRLVNQEVPFRAAEKLSKKRRYLEIVEGRSEGDGPGAQMVGSMLGGSSITTWKGGKMDGESDPDEAEFL